MKEDIMNKKKSLSKKNEDGEIKVELFGHQAQMLKEEEEEE